MELLMRAAMFLVALAACTPDIVSGSYLCGPDASCPEGQSCNGPDNTCVFASTAQPFSCEAEIDSEPDNTSAEAHLIDNLGCVSVPFVNANCMLEGDAADWVRFVAPSVCTSVGVEARVSFPIAFERIALELWDLDRDVMIATDGECSGSGEAGEELRCLNLALVPGGSYGIKVKPAGDGNCSGACAYNRYTLRVQLATPG
jgi:hypothetical protein